MNRANIKLVLFFIIGLLLAFLVMYFFSNYNIEKKNDNASNMEITSKSDTQNLSEIKEADLSNNPANIDELTAESKVIEFVKTNHRLPDCYITKSEARKSGWIASKGNLCDVLPGKAIGGDQFSNREKHLPNRDQYYEADVNYNCGNRNADRIVYTKNGDVYLTKNHYRSFEKQ